MNQSLKTLVICAVAGLCSYQTYGQVVTAELDGNRININVNYASLNDLVSTLEGQIASPEDGFCIPLTVPLDTALGSLLSANMAVKGKLGIGVDVVNGETLSETLLLKENNLRIKFKDTSTSAAFPTTDWEIQANSNLNGGESYFGIVDLDAEHMAFAIEAAAADSALVILSDGTVKASGIMFPDETVQTAAVPAPAEGSATLGTMMFWDGTQWLHIAPGSNGETLTWCNGVPTWGPCLN